MPLDIARNVSFGFTDDLVTARSRLAAVDELAADRAACRVAGLRRVPDSRRLGECLARMSDDAVGGLQSAARRLAPAVNAALNNLVPALTLSKRETDLPAALITLGQNRSEAAGRLLRPD